MKSTCVDYNGREMEKITVGTAKPYEVTIGNDVLGGLAEVVGQGKKVCIVSDDRVGALYADCVRAKLSGCNVSTYFFPHGERSKNLKVYGELLSVLAERQLTRSDCLIALGGGVTGDLCGFVAATYLRGVDYVQIPTSLLAMVDSSVGGKTAVNLPEGKNLVGAFYQPKAVFCELPFLKTLPKEEWKNGLGEVIKYGFIADEALLQSLEKQNYRFDCPSAWEKIIARCVAIKAEFAACDEFDRGQRQKLNFGHTLGHAVELSTSFQIPHGQAVGIGMKYITRWNEKRQGKSPDLSKRVEALLKKFDMLTDCDVPEQELWRVATTDKKRKGNRIDLILVEQAGHAEICPTELKELL